MKIRKIQKEIAKINDPRRQYGNLQYKLETIMGIAFCATICGVDDYPGMETFGKKRMQWLSKHFDMSNGVPDEQTFMRLFARLDPTQVGECLRALLEKPGCKGKTVAIDGKSMRGATGAGHDAPHVVSAWVGEDHITLGEVATEEKSNEITAIPQLLDLVDVEGATLTIDAMGCQKAIAAKIVEKKAGYCLALKDNHPDLHENVRFFFENDRAAQRFGARAEKDHGRVEERFYALETDIAWLPGREDWAGLAAVGAAFSRVWEKGETREKTRYYITSLTDAGAFAKAVREHWSVENQLHWRLDVTFREDASRVRKGNAPLVMNVMRKTAISFLKRADLGKYFSLKRKKLAAILDENTLELIVFGKSK